MLNQDALQHPSPATGLEGPPAAQRYLLLSPSSGSLGVGAEPKGACLFYYFLLLRDSAACQGYLQHQHRSLRASRFAAFFFRTGAFLLSQQARKSKRVGKANGCQSIKFSRMQTQQANCVFISPTCVCLAAGSKIACPPPGKQSPLKLESCQG